LRQTTKTLGQQAEMVFQRALLHACLVPEAAFTLVIAAGGLLLPASTARADVETVTVRLEEARCFS